MYEECMRNVLSRLYQFSDAVGRRTALFCCDEFAFEAIKNRLHDRAAFVHQLCREQQHFLDPLNRDRAFRHSQDVCQVIVGGHQNLQTSIVGAEGRQDAKCGGIAPKGALVIRTKNMPQAGQIVNEILMIRSSFCASVLYEGVPSLDEFVNGPIRINKKWPNPAPSREIKVVV